MTTKYYYNHDTTSLYFLQDDYLMTVPQMADGTFDLHDAYEVWEHDKALGSEPTGDYRLGRTLADVWADARKAINKNEEA